MAEQITKEKFQDSWRETQKSFSKIAENKETLLEMMNMNKQDLNIVYKNAYDAFKVEDYTQAENLFLSLLLWDFKDYNYQVGLAAAYEAQEKFAEALSLYSLAMLTGGQNPEILFRTGKCLLALGEQTEAKLMFELAADFGTHMQGINLALLGAVEKSKKMLELINS